MKKESLLMLMLASIFTLGVLAFSFNVDENEAFALTRAAEAPMRIDLSYENRQLTNDTDNLGTYRLARVKTYRNNEIKLLQHDVSYIDEDQKVRLSLDGWFGNIGGDSGVERNEIKGMTKIHFVEGSNIKVQYSWSATSGTIYEETPDANGDVYFSGLKPSYFKVVPSVNEQVLFSSCEIYYDCESAPAPTAVTADNVQIKQSHYGANPGDLYVYDSPETSWATHLETGNYVYAKVGTAYNDLDKHNIVLSFDFAKPIAGKTHHEGVRLDDPFVTNLAIERVNGGSTIDYGEQTLSVSFTYKGFGTISNQTFKVVGFYRSTVGHQVVSVDNVKQQADNTLPGDNAVTVQSLVTFFAFAAKDQFSLSSHQIHIAHTIFHREIKFKDLPNLQLDANPFTAVGEHELAFNLDTRYALHGTYVVYDESNYVKSVAFNGFKDQIEPGEDLASYFNGGNASVTLNYQDGTSNTIVIKANSLDLSLVNSKVEGTYPYYVNIAGYRRIQRYVSVVMTGIGDETGADIYSPTESTKGNVYAYGVDDYGSLTKLYITSIVAKDNKYRAECETENGETAFERFGTYAIDEFNNEKELVLFGQLWSSRLKFEVGANEHEFVLLSHAEIENGGHYVDTVYTPDEESYNMFESATFHFYSSPYDEIMIDLGNEPTTRTTCTYLNEEKSRISFQFPFYTIIVTFEATIYENDQGVKKINVETPAYL